jgi:hypothetical protein
MRRPASFPANLEISMEIVFPSRSLDKKLALSCMDVVL